MRAMSLKSLENRVGFIGVLNLLALCALMARTGLLVRVVTGPDPVQHRDPPARNCFGFAALGA
jgi:hypothetical protein